MPVERSDKLPKIDECIKGRIYKIRCRNFSFGVCNGTDGFIGIRTKFNSRFLFTEYHWDTGAPYGTVAEAIDTGVDIPLEVEASENKDLYYFLDGFIKGLSEEAYDDDDV